MICQWKVSHCTCLTICLDLNQSALVNFFQILCTIDDTETIMVKRLTDYDLKVNTTRKDDEIPRPPPPPPSPTIKTA